MGGVRSLSTIRARTPLEDNSPFFVGGAPLVYTGSHNDVSMCHTSRDARLVLKLQLVDSDSVCTRAIARGCASSC